MAEKASNSSILPDSTEDGAASPVTEARRWVTEFGEGLGHVARSVVEGFETLWKMIDNELTGPEPRRSRRGPPTERTEEKMPDLLQQLADLLSRHTGQGYDALVKNEELERLIARVHYLYQRLHLRARMEEIRSRRNAQQVSPIRRRHAAPGRTRSDAGWVIKPVAEHQEEGGEPAESGGLEEGDLLKDVLTGDAGLSPKQENDGESPETEAIADGKESPKRKKKEKD